MAIFMRIVNLPWWRVVLLLLVAAGLGYLAGTLPWPTLAQVASLLLFGLWTSPKTWSSVVVTVADLNTHIRDNLNVLKTWIGDDGYPLWTGIAKSSTYTWTITDPSVILVSGTFTLSAPSSPPTGKPFMVKKTDSTGLVTVAGNGHTIDGGLTFALGPYDAFTFVYTGSEWSVF